MERQDILDLMGTLKLYGMRSAFDEIIANGLKRQHPVQKIVADLLKAEIDEKQARSIKYQMTIAKLPLAKDLREFEFAGSPVNETLVRALATDAALTLPVLVLDLNDTRAVTDFILRETGLAI